MSTEQHGMDACGQEVRAAALRCTWALADLGYFLIPEASDEVLAMVLSTLRKDE